MPDLTKILGIRIKSSPRPNRGWLVRLKRMLDIRHERRRLRQLDDRLLRDIGIDREMRAEETSRLPWDLPPGRK